MDTTGKDQQKITIRIDTEKILLSIQRSEDKEECLRNASKLTNLLLTKYRQAYPQTTDKQRFIYTALHIARDLEEEKLKQHKTKLADRINSLIEKIDATLQIDPATFKQ